MLTLLESIVEFRLNDGCAIVFDRLFTLDKSNLSLHLSYKLVVDLCIDLCDLAVQDAMALLVVPSHTLQQLKEFSPRHAR